ncbi:MAG: hypothetical protein WC505_06725 [Patescibacteria group bacterium]
MTPKFIRVAGKLYRKAEGLEDIEAALNAVVKAKSVLQGLGIDFSDLVQAEKTLKAEAPKPSTQKIDAAVKPAPELIRVAGKLYRKVPTPA